MRRPPQRNRLFKPSLTERYIRFVLELPRGRGDLLQSLGRQIAPLIRGWVLTDLDPLIRCSDRIWEAHEVWKLQGTLPDFGFLSQDALDQRITRIDAGLTENLPLRLRPLFERVADAHSSVDLSRFALLTLPVFERQFRRRHCCWKRKLFEIGYVLRDGTPAESVLPDMEFENYRLLSSASHGCPEVDLPPPNWQVDNVMPDGRPAGIDGFGIKIGHPDTGWTRHPDLNIVDGDPLLAPNFDLARDIDFLSQGGDPPPLNDDGTVDSSAEEPLLSGTTAVGRIHGTRTASVMVGQESNQVRGIAPGAVIHSYRVSDNVVLTGDVNVAQSVRAATLQGVDVISISLGGYPAAFLYEAIWDAIQNHCIVIASAGNWTKWPVFPAAYDPCIAVAGTTWDDQPWYGSTFNGLGQDVIDVAAPAACIVGADWNPDFEPVAERGAGTSYSAPLVAAAAALWLRHHGKQTLIDRLPDGVTLQELFQDQLRKTARIPDIDPPWNVEGSGPGILNIGKLLEPIEGVEDFQGRPWNQATTPPSIESTAGLYVRGSPEGTQIALQAIFGAGGLGMALSQYSDEIVRLLMGDETASELMDNLVAVIEDDVQNAIDGAGELAEDVADAAEEFIDSVGSAVSDGLATVAGWLG